MAYGLTAQGYEAPRSADFLDEIRNEFLEELKKRGLPTSVDFERDVVYGVLTTIMAARLGRVSEGGQAVYDSRDLNNATGIQLDNLCLLVGIRRREATASTAIVTLSGDIGTDISEGRLVEGADGRRWRVADNREIGFAIVIDTVLAGAQYVAAVDGHQFSYTAQSGDTAADVVAGLVSAANSNAAVSNIVEARTADSDGDGAADRAVFTSTSGSYSFSRSTGASMSPVNGVNYVTVEAVETGPTQAVANAIDTIATPVDGWDSVTNDGGAAVGRKRETDDELRLRRQQSLQITGGGAIPAIRANVLDVDGIVAAVVIDNDADQAVTKQGVTLNANSYAVIVWPDSLDDSTKEAVVDAIYRKSPAGIRSMGTDVQATVTGRDGFPKDINFDFASDLPVDIGVTLTLDSGYGLDDVDDAIGDLIDDYFAALGVGDAVRRLTILSLIATVDGVTGADVTLNSSATDVTPTITEITTVGTITVSL